MNRVSIRRWQDQSVSEGAGVHLLLRIQNLIIRYLIEI